MNYVIAAHSHPPCDSIASLFTKRFARRRQVGAGIPTRRSSVELIFYLYMLHTQFNAINTCLPRFQLADPRCVINSHVAVELSTA